MGIFSDLQSFVATPAQSKSTWFLGEVADTFNEYAPSYIAICALVSTIGCLHHYLIGFQPNNQQQTYSLTRTYSALAQMAIACISFMTVIDKPHLQQILSTVLLLSANFVKLAPTTFSRVFGALQQRLSSTEQQHQQGKKLGHGMEKKSGPSWDEMEEKDDYHQKSKQQQQTQPPQQPTLYSSQSHQQSSSSQKNQSNGKTTFAELSSVSRLILTWLKTAIISYFAALPTSLANHSHISLKKSILNPFSWFSSGRNEYSMFNPFSLSMVNAIGVLGAAFAIMWYASPSFRERISGITPSWYNSRTNYFIFSSALFLTSYSLKRPLTWLSIISPTIAFCFAALRLLIDYNQSNNQVPSLIRKIHKQSWAGDTIKFGEKMLPGIPV